MQKDYVIPKIKIIFVESTDIITASATATGAFKTEWLGGYENNVFDENGGNE